MNKKQGTTKVGPATPLSNPMVETVCLFELSFSDCCVSLSWMILDWSDDRRSFFSSWLCNFLDQAFTWSRAIDRHGYHLRSWWHRQKYQHHEIEDFELDEYAKRKLIMIRFRDNKGENEYGEDHRVPFPCTFGRSPDDVFKTLRSNLNKSAVSKT